VSQQPPQKPPEPILTGHIKRGNWGWLLRDILLLPPALLYVIVEQVFWVGAKALLVQAARLHLIATLQKKLERLPAWAVLPLFLVPEIFSHVGGFWASYLLVHRAWLAALLIAIFLKGTATLMVVWIYQSCQTTLLSIRWFAGLHGKFMAGRDWVAGRMRPLLNVLRRLVSGGRAGVTRRFGAMRKWLRTKLGLRPKP
jgi:hypothetical protein